MNMNVEINGQSHQIPETCTLEKLLELHAIEAGSGLGLAVNQRVIAQQQWSQTRLKDGDRVLIIRPFQGG